MTSDRIRVMLDNYGGGDGPDVVSVYIDGKEVTAWCVGDEPEHNRDDMERVVRAAERVGRESADAEIERLTLALEEGRQLLEAACRERDEARAEVERLGRAIRILLADGVRLTRELDEARAELERLRSSAGCSGAEDGDG